MRERELKQTIIEEFLSVIEDPRVDRTRRHSLETILVISLLGVICGADSFVAIERFAEAKRAWLSGFLDLSGGVPSHDTIGRVFAALNPRSLAEAFRRWTLAMNCSSKEKLIAIDGKSLRRSFRKAGDHAFVHMVSAWSATNRVVLGQVKTEDKSNEVTAIPVLLDLIEVTGALVTIDAAGTQVAIAEKIVDKGGDYMLAVKANQPTLHESIIEHFADERNAGSFGVYETEEKAHGRHETRRAWVSHSVEEIATHDRWSKLSAIIRIQATRSTGKETSTEDRYFISSRPLLSAIDALHVVRGHWVFDVHSGSDLVASTGTPYNQW